MSQSVRIRNTTRETMLAEHGEVADNPWRRLKGLIGRRGFEPGEGLVLQDCRGIHTWFMGFPIDVLHVDRTCVVRRVMAKLPPNRFGPIVWRSSFVVELPAGVVQASGTRVGDRLSLD